MAALESWTFLVVLIIHTTGSWSLKAWLSISENREYWSLIYFNYSLPQTAISYTKETKTACSCKYFCFALNCGMVSTITTENGTVECLVSMKEISEVVLTRFDRSFTYVHRTDDYFLGRDGLFYSLLREENTMQNAINYCDNTYPNGRLIMPKTILQLDSLMDFKSYASLDLENSYVLVDMKRNTLNTAVWGDGTPYTKSEVSQETKLDSGLLDTLGTFYAIALEDGNPLFKSVSSSSYVICQLDPLGLYQEDAKK